MKHALRVAVVAVGAAATAALLLPIAPTSAGTAASVKLPTADAKWDYQIGQAYKPRKGVAVVSRDREAKPFAAGYTMCYVNAFQTQPSEVRWWKHKHPGLLLKKDGKYVVDGFWGETLLDTSTKAKRAKLARIVGKWIAGCGNDGFQAIEPDNLDSWTRSKGQLTRDDNFKYAGLLIAKAHREGLAIGQKNAAGATARGAKAGFDFAVAEECGRWRECKAYMNAYGNQVYVIEYRLQDFRYSCQHWGDQLSIVYRNLMVTAPGSKHYVYKSC
ncbi:MAG: endo alpha-1,4 polygalactosaminidase [Actinomycetes bacterium]